MGIKEYLAELVMAQLENRKPLPVPEGITTEQLMEIAGNNHMDYLLLGALVKAEGVTGEEQEKARARVKHSVIRTLAQIMELKQIEQRFEEEHVKSQPMKGARMKFIYPSPEMREMSDIDILIDAESMERAKKVLLEMGYCLKQSVKHHDIYHKPPFMVVEAHRAMYDKTVDNNQYKYFSGFTKAVLREGMQYTYDFTTEDFYVYMMAHMAKHFYTMGCGIRNLVDVYIYLEKYGSEMNRQYVNEELKNCGILEFTEHMEKLAYIWLKGEKGSQFYDDLFLYMLNSGIYGKDENGIWNKFSEEKMKDREVTLKELKKWYYFPPVSYMSEYYPWLEDYPYLLPVAWGIRAYRGIFLKKGVHKREMLQDIEQEQVRVYKNIYQKMQLHFKR